MRWSMLPVSIVVHVLLAGALVIVPLAAQDEWPRPAPLHSLVLELDHHMLLPTGHPTIRVATPRQAARAMLALIRERWA